MSQLLPVCLSYGVFLSVPSLHLETAMADHLIRQGMMGSLTSIFLRILNGRSIFRTLAWSRMVRPATSAGPLDWCSPTGGCSGVTLPPWHRAKAYPTATMSGSPSLLKRGAFFATPGYPHDFNYWRMSLMSQLWFPAPLKPMVNNPHVLVPRRLINHHHHGVLGRVGRGSSRLKLGPGISAIVLDLRDIPLLFLN